MSNKPNRRNRGFDWYSLRQRFSIRKYHFGAASVLLGVAIASLATGPLAQAEEIDLSTQPAVEVPVPETPPAELPVEVPEVPVVESLPNPEPEAPVLEAPVAPAEVVPEVTAEPVAPEAPAAPEVEVPVERQAGIVYHASYVEETTKEEVGKGKPQATIVTTTEEKASAEVTVTADYLPKGYELSDPAKTSVTATVHEGQANPVAFSVRPVAVPETKVVTEGYTGFRAIPGENRTAFSGNQNFKNYQGFSRDKLLNQITWIDFSDASTISGTGTAPNQADGNKLAPSLRIGTKYKKVIAPGYEVTLEVIGLKPFEATEIYKERIAGTDREQYFDANRKNHIIRTGEQAEIIAVKQDKTWSQAARQGLNFGEKAVTLQSHKDGGNVGVIFRGSATYLGNSVPINFVLMESEEAKRDELVIFTTNGENFELLGELSNDLTLSSYSPITTAYFEQNRHRFNDVTIPNNWGARFDALDYVNVGTSETIATAGQTSTEENMTLVDGLGTKVFGPVTNRMKSKTYPNEEYSTPILLTKNASEVGMFITSLGRQSAMIGVMVYDEGDAPASYGEGKHALNLNVADKNPFLGTVMADLDFVPEAIPADAAPWYRDELINQWDEGPIQLLGASDAAKNNNNYTLHHSSNGSYELKLQASANGNPKAHMQGWIDFNNNGIFDDGEASGVVEVTSANTYTLNFTGIPQITDTDLTKLGVRVRIAVDRNDILTPHLTALSGEVEDFQVQLTHPPRGTKKETTASQGETQRATVEFFAYGKNAYESTAAKIDETIPPSIVKEDGQLVQDSELVDGYYVVPGEGRYKITANGKNVDVEFIPEVNFVTKRTDGSIVKQAKGITIRRTGTVVDKAGTAAYTTGWTANTAENQLENISDQTNTMDGRYIPHVVAVVPSGIDATSSAVQGAVQTGRPTFVPGTISTGAQVPMDPNTTKLLDEGSNPVDATTAYAMVNGVRTVVGEYRISSTDGTVTYTPNDEGKRYIGSLLPVTVQAKDVNGSAATATYTPTITPLSPSAVAATSVGLQGKEQTGRPTFAKGTTIDGVGELVPSSLTLLDASGQPATRVDVPNQGSYVLNPDGSITFTPLPDYYGSPTPVNVRQADSNGSTVVTTYSPNVIEVRPIADPDKTYGLKGAEQTSRSDYFTAGQIDLNGDKVYNPATEVVALNPASRKLINQQGQEVDSVQVAGEGVYRLNGDGTITFTPEPDFVGLANGVTITIADVNGTKVSTTYVPKVIDVPEDELKETVKRTIHYVYADGREASTSVEKVLEYTRTATANPLTGEISYSPWESTDNDFPLVTSPVITNYTASQDDVKERRDVPAEAVDETITIVYRKHDKQLATFTYRVVDGPELAKDQEIGYSSAPITYTTDAKIAEIIARGYELVKDGFANEANKSFDTDTARVQNWDILFRPKTIVTTPDQPKVPGDQVDPSIPDSPRWEEVTKTITRTVSYKLNTVDGPEAPGTSSQTNTVTFERTGTYNFVSNQITYTNWVAKDGDATLEGHALPDVLGYTATKATANDEEVLPLSTTRNKTVTHLDNNITEIVVYTPDAQLGKISFINVTDPSQEVLVREIPLTGKTGDKFTVDTAAIIEEFRQQGYEVSDISNYDKEGLFSPDPNSHDEFVYHLTERVVPYDPENPDPTIPKWPDSVKGIVTKDEVKRTISYVDEAGAPLSPVFEDTVSFTRTATVNLITGAVTYGPWQAVDSDKELAGNPLPSLAGYSVKRTTSDAVEVEASVTETPRLVEAEAADIVEVVTYQKDRQEAIIRFVDVTNPQAKKELNTISLSGKSSEEIGYDVTPLVNSYEASGYLVSNKHSYAPTTPYDTDKDVPQEFVFELVQKTTPSTPDNPQTPGTPVDPNNPDGPVWEEVTKTITRTVAYKLDTVDGQPAPTTETKTNSVTFERTGSYNHVTKQVTYTDWVAKDGDSTLEGQTLPLVTGYVAVTATRNNQTVTPSATAEAIEASAKTDNVDEIVVYKALSSWTITPPPGTDPVPPIPYDNHPTDPTKPADPTPTPAIPKVDGYVPVGPDGNELPKDPDGNYIPPKPTDPTKPTEITYKPVAQKASITFVNKTNPVAPVELTTIPLTGKSGDQFGYDPTPLVKDYEMAGYVVTNENDYAATKTYSDDPEHHDSFVFSIVEKTATIVPEDPNSPDDPNNPNPGDPVDPNNPDGPKWEDVSRTITRKVSYVVESPEGETVTAPEGKTTTVTFERTGSYNFVTKQVTYTDWEAKDGDAVLEGNPLPVIDGYVAIAATKNGDKVEASTTAEDVTATETTTDISEVVTYKKLSSWTITPPPGNDPVPDIPYENDPNDPTKPADPKPTRPNEEDPNNPIPTVPDYPGYVPVDPDGNELPKDDDGNYIPPKPKDPSQPTPITYKPVEQVGKISFVDVTVPENPVTKVTIDLSGKTGDKLGMDVSSIVTMYENLGYTVTNKDNYDKDGTFGPDLKSNTFVYELVERTVDIDPDDPNTPTPKPGEPVDPNNPDGPKWPDSVRDLVTTEEVTRTISYVDTKGNTVFEEIKETKTFKRTAKVNIVTDAITYGDWSADQTFEKVTSPLKDNHLVDKLEVPASTVKAEDEDINEVVTYTLLGQWKPVVPPGTKPVPPVTYPRDPEDPTKPGTEVPTIPAIPGTIPVYPDPNNPGQTIPLKPSPDGGYELPPVPSKPGEDTVIEYVPNTVSLTVKYVDDTGADLRPTESKEVKVGDDYTTTPQMIEGYYLTEIPANSKGKVGAEGTTVVYVYNKLGSWVPELPEGHDPVPPIPYPNHPTDPGKPGIPTGVVPVVPGYIPVGPDGKELPKGPDGNYLPPVPSKPGEDTVIKYIPQDASVTVRYVDDKGNDLIPSKSIPGKVGDDYTTTPEIIKGYLLKEVPSNASGKIPAGGTSVVYTYVPIGSYVPNIPGQPSTPIPYPNHPTDPGKPGTDLPSIPHVPGYIPVGPGGVPLQPVDPSDPTKGYIAPPIPGNPGQDTPINYIPSPPARPSRPIVVTPVKPETPVEPEVPTTPAQPSPAGPAQPASPGTAQLPNTGTSDSHAVTVIGASLFLAALAIAGTARRREE
ncbi:TPA: mucin-binding protein [Streptococcus suis]